MICLTQAIVLSVAVVLGGVGAQNFSGKWSLSTSQGQGRRSEILALNQVGNSVIGTLGDRLGDVSAGTPQTNEIFEPKVDGDSISFYVWRGSDHPVKIFYKGTLSGDEIDFTVTGSVTPSTATSVKAIRTQ